MRKQTFQFQPVACVCIKRGGMNLIKSLTICPFFAFRSVLSTSNSSENLKNTFEGNQLSYTRNMAENKARGYGLSAEVQRKINAKYDKEVEEDVRRWIEDVLEEPVEWGAEDSDSPGSGFADGLMDGQILCKLANKLQPGAVKMNDTKKVTNAAMRTNKEKENIEKFLKFAEAYGVKDRFTTPYLYQKQNVMSVVNCLCQLGSAAQNKGFSGPCLGPKIAEENKRNFTEEQLCEGKKHIGLQMGTNKLASQAGEHFGRARQVAGIDAYK